MVATRKLTILMAHQDGTPFAGCASVRLNSASKTDEELVGPLAWQESDFDAEGKVELQLVPNSELEEGTWYRAEVYQTRTQNGARSKIKVFSTAFTMPDADSCLHDLAVVEPVRPSALDAMQTLLSEAAQASAQNLSVVEARLGAVEGAMPDKLNASDVIAENSIDSLFDEEEE